MATEPAQTPPTPPPAAPTPTPRPAYKLVCTWLALSLFGLATALTAGLIPEHYWKLVVWVISLGGAAGSIMLPGWARFSGALSNVYTSFPASAGRVVPFPNDQGGGGPGDQPPPAGPRAA